MRRSTVDHEHRKHERQVCRDDVRYSQQSSKDCVAPDGRRPARCIGSLLRRRHRLPDRGNCGAVDRPRAMASDVASGFRGAAPTATPAYWFGLRVSTHVDASAPCAVEPVWGRHCVHTDRHERSHYLAASMPTKTSSTRELRVSTNPALYQRSIWHQHTNAAWRRLPARPNQVVSNATALRSYDLNPQCQT